MNDIKKNEEVTIVLHSEKGDLSYYDEESTIEIRERRAVAILGDRTNWSRVRGSKEPLVKAVGNLAYVYLERLDLLGTGSGDRALVLEGDSSAVVDWCKMVTFDNYAVDVAVGATVTIRHSMLWSNNDGVENDDNNSVIDVQGGLAHIIYSTIVNSSSDGIHLNCGGYGDVFVRNGILISGNDALQCPGADVSNSAGVGILSNTGNLVINTSLEDIQGYFVNINASSSRSEIDLHLTEQGETVFKDVAVRAVGDLSVDIDGDPRPAIGEPDYAGADVPQLQ
ncbi:MAG: hypothetical protein AAGF11_38170 [Myxococcota bacterium]